MRDQLITAITAKLLPRYAARFRDDVPWGVTEARNALQSATTDQRQEMLRALLKTSAVREHLKALAEQEAATMLQNDSLDLDELKRIGI